MAVHYYSDSNDYPEILKIVMERLRLYFCNFLYPEETFEQSKSRFIIAEITSSEDLIYKAIEQFPTGDNTTGTNSSFPFTAYNIGDEEPVEERSHYQKNSTYYSDVLNAYVTAIPYRIEIPMYTFFTNSFDYQRARDMMALDEACATRIECPCIINDIETSFPIDLDYKPTAGEFAYAFEAHLDKGKIYDINHTVTVTYHKFLLVRPASHSESGHQESIPIYPVDNIELSVCSMRNNDITQNTTIEKLYSSETPSIDSTTPTNDSIDIPIDLSEIVIDFSIGMNEYSVISNLDIIPFVNCLKEFNNDSTQLTLTLSENLINDTNYRIIINDKAKSLDNIPLSEDFILSFTTIEA